MKEVAKYAQIGPSEIHIENVPKFYRGYKFVSGEPVDSKKNRKVAKDVIQQHLGKGPESKYVFKLYLEMAKHSDSFSGARGVIARKEFDFLDEDPEDKPYDVQILNIMFSNQGKLNLEKNPDNPSYRKSVDFVD